LDYWENLEENKNSWGDYQDKVIKNIIELWKKCKSVQINVSVDGIDEHFNYLRWPLQWSQVRDNIRFILDQQLQNLRSLPAAPSSPPKANEMIKILVKGHETVAKTARSIFAIASKADDQPTADLLTQRLDIHEKTAWMLRSMLEK
jgi:hypothetical protein